MEKQIATAKQESASNVAVYDEKGNFLFNRSGQLVGFTPTSVTIKNGSRNEVYDNKGNFKFSR